MLSTVQSEKSQACKILIKESQYGLTCLAKAVLQFLISGALVTQLVLGHAPVTTEDELQRARAPIPLCYWWFQVEDFFMINTVVTTQFLDLFSLTLIHGATVCHTAMSTSTVHGADLPNSLHHCLCPFSGASLPYFTENWVGNILIHKLFSDHIPLSLSLQHPLLSCAILSYQYGCISSLTVITWARPRSTLWVHQATWSRRGESLPRRLPVLSSLPHESLFRSMWTEKLFCHRKCPIIPEQRTSQNFRSYSDTLGTVLRYMLRTRKLNFTVF